VRSTPSSPESLPTTGISAAGGSDQDLRSPLSEDATERGPQFTAAESRVLTALSEEPRLSFAVLRSRSALPPEELRTALDSLRARGLVTRLHTLGESYSSRFPGLRVDE